jgi:hypothetical protein
MWNKQQGRQGFGDFGFGGRVRKDQSGCFGQLCEVL